MPTIIIPAVLSTKDAHLYVGGKPLFDELLAKHPDLLKPIRTVTRGDSFWRRASIDAALAVAEQQDSLLAKDADGKLIFYGKGQKKRDPKFVLPETETAEEEE